MHGYGPQTIIEAVLRNRGLFMKDGEMLANVDAHSRSFWTFVAANDVMFGKLRTNVLAGLSSPGREKTI